MLNIIQMNNKETRVNNENKRKSVATESEQKEEHKYVLLSDKIDKLTRIVEDQHEIIMDLRNEIRLKFGISKLSPRKIHNEDDTSSPDNDFSSENSNTLSFKAKYLGHKKSLKASSLRKKFSDIKNFNVILKL
jgi:hypothetical protein